MIQTIVYILICINVVTFLSRQSHHDGEYNGIYQCWYRSLIGANELKAIHPFPQ